MQSTKEAHIQSGMTKYRECLLLAILSTVQETMHLEIPRLQ